MRLDSAEGVAILSVSPVRRQATRADRVRKGFAMCKFSVGSRVVVCVPNSVPFAATVSRVVVATGAIGGLFEVVADDGRKFHPDANLFAGDWMTPDNDADTACALIRFR